MTKRELLEALEGMQELLRWQSHILQSTIASLQKDVDRSGKQSKEGGCSEGPEKAEPSC